MSAKAPTISTKAPTMRAPGGVPKLDALCGATPNGAEVPARRSERERRQRMLRRLLLVSARCYELYNLRGRRRPSRSMRLRAPAWKSRNVRRNDALTCQVPCTAASHGVGTRLCPALDRGSSLGQSMVCSIWRLRLELFVAFHQFPRLGTFTGMAVASGSLKSLKVVQKGCIWEAGARSAGAAFLVACLLGAGFLVDVQG